MSTRRSAHLAALLSIASLLGCKEGDTIYYINECDCAGIDGDSDGGTPPEDVVESPDMIGPDTADVGPDTTDVTADVPDALDDVQDTDAVADADSDAALDTADAESDVDIQAEVEDEMDDLRRRFSMPALAGLVIRDGEIVFQAAVGLRSSADTVQVELDDPWHIAGCTVPMTATLAGLLVDDGDISWETTVGEVFTDIEIREDYDSATLLALLKGLAGTSEQPTAADDVILAGDGNTPREQRALLAAAVLGREAGETVGAYTYSNVGFIIAGAMLERVADASWEDLIQTRIFDALAMDSCGFGAPVTPDTVDAPIGHTSGGIPLGGGPGADNPPSFGPAGTVHCNLPDWSTFVTMQLDGANGESDFLERDTFAAIQTGAENQFAPGLGNQLDHFWDPGIEWEYAGSNTTFATHLWMSPDRNAAVLTATNRGDGPALDATHSLMELLAIEFAID